MSKLTVDFEFELGEVVYFRTAAHDLSRVPHAYVVQERVAQQCHGGVQMLYLLCPDKCGRVPGMALTRDKPPYQEMCAEHKAEVFDQLRRTREMEREVLWKKREGKE